MRFAIPTSQSKRVAVNALHLKTLGLLALVIAAQLFTGCATRPTEYREPPPLSAADRTKLNTQAFDRVWSLVNDKYFDANFRGVNWPAMGEKYRPQAAAARDDVALYRVLNELCSELKESHLTAISPRHAHEKRVDARVLIGIRWQWAAQRAVVVEVMPGGPAEQAGVKPGWVLVSRDGQPVGERLNEGFVAKVGQPIDFEFLDEQDRSRRLQIRPNLLTFPPHQSRDLAGGYRYLRFDGFTTDSMRWLSQELKAHREAPGVVLDFRANPGGNAFVLNVAVAEFFDRRVPTGRFIKRDGDGRDVHGLAWLSARYAGKVVILTSPATGSAAEIFAHVLQFHHRATVIGQKTAGAVILSRYYSLPGRGLLQLPFQDYVGLDGQRLEHRGVTPDIEVPRSTLAQLRTREDLELAAALKCLETH